MAIYDRILNRLRGVDPQTTAAQNDRDTSLMVQPPDRSMATFLESLTAVGGDRHETIQACRAMYAEDGRAEEILHTLARDATSSGFTVAVTDNPQAQEVADALIKRTGLTAGLLADYTKMAARDGDLLIELGIDDRAMHIVSLSRKPTLEMIRLSDEFDRFPDPRKAYAWTDRSHARRGKAGPKAIYFPAFAIVHGRWNHDSDSRYGRPEFASSQRAYKRVVEGELDVAIRRKTRAGVRYVHSLPDASPTDIEAYKEVNQEALQKPFAAVADYFISGGTISLLAGDADLANIGDVEHHIQTWSAASPVPLELLAYGANLNRDVLSDKRAQYEQTLSDTRNWITDQIIRPILERQWLLAGILPDALDYQITWTVAHELTADDLLKLVEAMGKMVELGLDRAAVWALLSGHLPAHITPDVLFGDLPPTGQPPTETPTAEAAMTAAARLVARLEALANA